MENREHVFFLVCEKCSCNSKGYDAYKYAKECIKIQLVPGTKFGAF